MPDITSPVSYTAEQSVVISVKLKDKNFTYKDWGKDDLLQIRTHIRNYYRDLKAICSYCRKDISLRSASNSHVEHIIPKSIQRNFIFEPKNLCAVCCDCNEIKSEKEVQNPLKRKKSYTFYPRSSNAFKVVHPHFDNYEEHIFKCGDFYIDLSQKGSYTILICQLNRKAHKFGIEPILLSKSELFDLMNKIMEETNFTRQGILMNKLREYFITTS
jgi:hypothetical protein